MHNRAASAHVLPQRPTALTCQRHTPSPPPPPGVLSLLSFVCSLRSVVHSFFEQEIAPDTTVSNIGFRSAPHQPEIGPKCPLAQRENGIILCASKQLGRLNDIKDTTETLLQCWNALNQAWPATKQQALFRFWAFKNVKYDVLDRVCNVLLGGPLAPVITNKPGGCAADYLLSRLRPIAKAYMIAVPVLCYVLGQDVSRCQNALTALRKLSRCTEVSFNDILDQWARRFPPLSLDSAKSASQPREKTLFRKTLLFISLVCLPLLFVSIHTLTLKPRRQTTASATPANEPNLYESNCYYRRGRRRGSPYVRTEDPRA